MDAVCPVFLSAPLLLSPSPTSLPSLISTHLHFNSSTKFQQIPQPSQISSLWTLTFSVLMCSPPCLDFDLNDFFFLLFGKSPLILVPYIPVWLGIPSVLQQSGTPPTIQVGEYPFQVVQVDWTSSRRMGWSWFPGGTCCSVACLRVTHTHFLFV